jgi:hypothetical protein
MSSYIRAAIGKYKDEISVALLTFMCCSYRRFVAAPDIYEVDNQAGLILSLRRILNDYGYYEKY